MTPYKNILKALNKAKVEYLVAGGVAVNLHNIVRATVDLDLIIHLEAKNVIKFGGVMKKLGYVPKVPVKAEEFADPRKRELWIREKGMIVFSYVNPNNPMELIDIFVREPFPFEKLYQRRKKVRAFGIVIPVLGVKDLLALKLKAGRDKDLYDIKLLKKKV